VHRFKKFYVFNASDDFFYTNCEGDACLLNHDAGPKNNPKYPSPGKDREDTDFRSARSGSRRTKTQKDKGDNFNFGRAESFSGIEASVAWMSFIEA
jgi:hypothetical protein